MTYMTRSRPYWLTHPHGFHDLQWGWKTPSVALPHLNHSDHLHISTITTNNHHDALSLQCLDLFSQQIPISPVTRLSTQNKFFRLRARTGFPRAWFFFLPSPSFGKRTNRSNSAWNSGESFWRAFAQQLTTESIKARIPYPDEACIWQTYKRIGLSRWRGSPSDAR